MERLTTSRLAQLGGVNLETIRYYERRGLLPNPPWTEAGYRQFVPDTAQRLRFIKRAQELGFTLSEIRELLMLRAEPGEDCSEVCRQAQQKLGEVRAKISQLRSIEKALRRLTAGCSGDRPFSECGILEALDADVSS